MTYKDIVHAIKDIKEHEPLTDKTSRILADLMYIRDHWHDSQAEAMDEAHECHQGFTEDIAVDWADHMKNEDGTAGPHWSMERIQQEIAQRGICCNLVEFWAVINAIYSDDCAVAKKHNVNTMDYYIDRTKAWLHDKDAVSDKAAAYYRYIVKH